MTLLRKNKTLLIDKEAASALELLKDGLLSPVESLMNEEQSRSVLKTGLIDGKSFPFPFILAPSGKVNAEVLSSLEKGEEITILFEKKPFATLIVDEVFSIDPNQRIRQIYGTDDISHPGVMATLKRIGSLAVSGEYTLLNKSSNTNKEIISEAKKLIDAKHTTALVMGANPLHRAHEKLIRQTLENTDLLVIFLLKPYTESNLSYEIRKKALDFFINNFLTKNHVVIVPLENSYIFAGYNEIIIDAVVAKNYGCDKLTIGRNHAGLGMFYDCNSNKSIIDKVVGIDIDITVSSEYVYCDKCTTLVSKNTCPHGQHHQISYHSNSILELLELGILPPTILMRKEISAVILSKLHPNRFKNLERLYYDILPVEGLLEEHTENDFYLELMKLYQTTSLT
ncbi:MAG: sulfate adenylyltransferase [Sulfurimonas sp.]|jgi:sulfate adenylyltransferase|uniref:sulfate adenylyltransferase n=1 Tax=unclassified Sulfurimonas TaxID=2623549 RepID=UPI0008CF6D58|nr:MULTISPECIES: sulfate adenylyltransferase [unclassified Sulfurimonas]MDD3854186.1 sulfate adenylyltransferase [Sulfurimonas sp.]MDO8261022.1 sulfate adenylyltransferase [Candidatus Magasanikbacteria bacterium]OHE05611.1 MAG: sulfate adenylyltransferase [Sulfurimonas sp. RIFOXYB12_FULL_35_9]OHE11518.1 MAG: sulfate adenylyltransferase [Sulfurimonas sp. RIFOXYC2_FULL_36_7]